MSRTGQYLSKVLRHTPEAAGLALDPRGWALAPVVLRGLRAAGHHLSLEDLHALVATDSKRRCTISDDGQKIRASQGHSIDVDLGLEPGASPDVLYHGTVAANLTRIRNEGLSKRKRHHVHLSPDRETAIVVGQRRGKPVILVVRAKDMHDAGYAFYLSDNGVWLTDSVPADYITFGYAEDPDRA